MANAADLLLRDPIRMLVAGFPGAGKTSSLIPLVDVGYKLRVLDYDGNFRPVLSFANPKMLHNVDVVTLQDRLRINFQGNIVPDGQPTAFTDGWKLMDHWRYDTPDGGHVDLGSSDDWDHTHILVVDSATTMGDAGMNAALHMQNRTTLNRRKQDWGLAADMQRNFFQAIRAKRNRFHVIVMAHLKLVSPPEVEESDDGMTQQIKRDNARIMPSKLFPNALGRQLPQNVAGLFDTVLLAERKVVMGKEKRVLTKVAEGMDVKVPANVPDEVDIVSHGLLPYFEAMVPWSVEAVRSEAR